MAHVFISYKREDRDFAFLVRNEIEKAGYGVWIDDRLEAGESWIRRIEDALSSAFALVLILTPQSQSSKYVIYEWSFALGRGIPVFPVLRSSIDATEMHQRLNDIHQIDFRYGYDWASLLRVIEHAAQGYPRLRTERDDLRMSEQVPEDVELRILLGRLKSPDAEIRLGAVRALGLGWNPEASHALSEILLNDANRRVRIAAAHALGTIGGAGGLSALEMVLLGSSDPDLRLAAIQAIENITTLETLPVLREALGDELPEVQRIAVRALSNFDDTDTISLLKELLDSPCPPVRWEAANGLLRYVKSTSPWDWVNLLGDMTTVEDDFLNLSGIAESALERLGTDQAEELLSEWKHSKSVSKWIDKHV